MKTLTQVVKSPSPLDSWSNYVGQTDFAGWDCLLTQNRDSDCLIRSNFRSALKVLGGEGDNVTIHRFGHWACGWWEALAVKQGTPEHDTASKLADRLENYPVVDDEDFSALEQGEANDTWKSCYSWRERVNYIREHPSQFEFRELRDILACVRGQYFAGYASELIN